MYKRQVLETIRAAERAEAAYERKMYRYKAHYSLDCDNGIENAVLLKPQTPEMVLEEKQFQEQVYAAVMKLPEKQAKRIYARYYLGMTVNEIAEVEGVDPSRVRDSKMCIRDSSSGYPSDFTIPTASGLEWALFPSCLLYTSRIVYIGACQTRL